MVHILGAYGCHPFVSMNYNGTVDSMFTLIHEMGHSMHSHYTWSTQPVVYGDYTIFVAEVASTVNEALLMEHLLKTTEDKNQRKYLINYYLEQFRGTLFRQTMFAEFELEVHRRDEAGEALTKEELNEIYYNLNKKYYGDEINIDEKYLGNGLEYLISILLSMFISMLQDIQQLLLFHREY